MTPEWRKHRGVISSAVSTSTGAVPSWRGFVFFSSPMFRAYVRPGTSRWLIHEKVQGWKKRGRNEKKRWEGQLVEGLEQTWLFARTIPIIPLSFVGFFFSLIFLSPMKTSLASLIRPSDLLTFISFPRLRSPWPPPFDANAVPSAGNDPISEAELVMLGRN